MNPCKDSSTFTGFFSALLCLLLLSVSTEAFSAVIDNIEIDDKASPPQLRINFTIPLQYLNHVPESSGDELEIQFQNISRNTFSIENALNEQQIVTAAKSSKVIPLLDARYEQRSASRGVIIIRFSRSINYSVQPGTDRRHITITVLTPETEKAPPSRPTDLQRPDTGVTPEIKPTLPAVPDEKIAALMEEARQAVASGNNSRAVQLYTKVLQYPDNPYRQDALEFLGVARERKGQLAHAIKEYQTYLALYPEGEGAERVKQRLAGLTTAADKPRVLAPGTRRIDEPSAWDVYGGLSQFYRRNEVSIDDNEDSVTLSSLTTDLDVTARRRSRDYDLQSRFTGSYLYDFLNDGPGDETSVSSLYFEASSKPLGLSMRLGRQSRNTGGVLGRFDGLLASYKMTDWLTLNAVGGYPVFSSRDDFDTDKTLYGVSADIGTLANAWDFNAFIIEQKVHNIVDRRAIGGETRYFDPVHSILTFVDYDIFYNSLNTFIFLGTWTLPGKTTITATLDYRNSPLLTTSSALQGQSVDSIADLLDSLDKDEIKQLAEDRTGKSKTATLGITYPFSKKIQLSGDITYSNLKGTKTSGDVEGIPDTGNEYFYNFQLIGSSLIKPGDISIFGLRYSDTSTANIYTLSLDNRFPLNSDFRINPRIRLDYRENNNDDSTQTTVLPSIRIDYRLRKHFRIEIETGKEWTSRDFTDRTEDSNSYFISIGYRADF